ncbi:unnamed protein product [Paramecium pentaurelia]|uniref:Transmembrane protein n=1 Tax=Paramecium pentaurelia TaxID=43138 RepID=A0A8S1SQR6_9CILI|nr:unnamed protein product [Paramecium pentaurelia]
MNTSSKPFIIRHIQENYLVSSDSTSFNAIIEKRIQFVQGANTFIAVMLSYDSIQHGFQFFQYYDKCLSYAYMIGALLIGNIFWILCSIFGFYSIDAKNSQKIHRILVYGYMAYQMNQFNFYPESEKVISDIVCESLNQTGLIIIQITIESVVLLIMIYFSHSIRHYIRLWEFNENSKNWGGV